MGQYSLLVTLGIGEEKVCAGIGRFGVAALRANGEMAAFGRVGLWDCSHRRDTLNRPILLVTFLLKKSNRRKNNALFKINFSDTLENFNLQAVFLPLFSFNNFLTLKEPDGNIGIIPLCLYVN